MIIGSLLCPTMYVSQLDVKVFSNWENKKITTSMAIEEFKWNNKIPEDVKIDAIEFEYWLRTLGYKREN